MAKSTLLDAHLAEARPVTVEAAQDDGRMSLPRSAMLVVMASAASWFALAAGIRYLFF